MMTMPTVTAPTVSAETAGVPRPGPRAPQAHHEEMSLQALLEICTLAVDCPAGTDAAHRGQGEQSC